MYLIFWETALKFMNVVDLFAKERKIQNFFVNKVSQFESPHCKSILYTIELLMVSILEPFYEALHLIRRILK